MRDSTLETLAPMSDRSAMAMAFGSRCCRSLDWSGSQGRASDDTCMEGDALAMDLDIDSNEGVDLTVCKQEPGGATFEHTLGDLVEVVSEFARDGCEAEAVIEHLFATGRIRMAPVVRNEHVL